MTDLGVLTLPADGNLSTLRVSADGYSSIARGGTRLFPIKTVDGRLYFSRSAKGDGASSNELVLVTEAAK